MEKNSRLIDLTDQKETATIRGPVIPLKCSSNSHESFTISIMFIIFTCIIVSVVIYTTVNHSVRSIIFKVTSPLTPCGYTL